MKKLLISLSRGYHCLQASGGDALSACHSALFTCEFGAYAHAPLKLQEHQICEACQLTVPGTAMLTACTLPQDGHIKHLPGGQPREHSQQQPLACFQPAHGGHIIWEGLGHTHLTGWILLPGSGGAQEPAHLAGWMSRLQVWCLCAKSRCVSADCMPAPSVCLLCTGRMVKGLTATAGTCEEALT